MEEKALHDAIAGQQDNICQITALRDGKPFYRDCWHGFRPADALHVMSVTKSVVSLLIGIGLDRGLLSDVEQPVLDFFPDYPIKRGEKTIQSVTVAHLLTMTAPYKYKSEPWTRVCTSDDWTLAALDLLGGRGGLTGAFRYSTLGVHILTGILSRQSGMETADFANRFLFGPLGIAPHRRFEAHTVEEHRDFILSKAPKENVWFSDPKGVCTAGYGLCLSADDLAKLGQLCLNGGLWAGQRVVSESWLRESLRPRFPCGEAFGHMSYGYLWWTPDPAKSARAAVGDGGNVLYLDPETGVTVAVTSTFKPRIFDRVRFIQEHILPLAESAK